MSDLDKSFQKAIAASKKGPSFFLGDEVTRIRNRLFRLYNDWPKLSAGGATHPGEGPSVARSLDAICEIAAEFGASLEKGQINTKHAADRVKRVRKALGYTS